jgi:hypothetical protein
MFSFFLYFYYFHDFIHSAYVCSVSRICCTYLDVFLLFRMSLMRFLIVLVLYFKANGRGLVHQLKNFEFIFCLQMMHPILQLVLKVSKSLQRTQSAICNCWHQISPFCPYCNEKLLIFSRTVQDN